TQAQVDVTAVAAGPITLTALVDSGEVPLPVAQTDVQVVLANEPTLRIEIGPFASHTWFYSEYVIGDLGAVDRALLAGVAVSIGFTPRLALEGELGVGDGKFATGDHAFLGETSARLLVHILTGKVRPFLGVGGGVIQAFPGTRASGEAVAGFKVGRGWG